MDRPLVDIPALRIESVRKNQIAERVRLIRTDVGLETVDARKARAALIEIERGVVVAVSIAGL